MHSQKVFRRVLRNFINPERFTWENVAVTYLIKICVNTTRLFHLNSLKLLWIQTLATDVSIYDVWAHDLWGHCQEVTFTTDAIDEFIFRQSITRGKITWIAFAGNVILKKFSKSKFEKNDMKSISSIFYTEYFFYTFLAKTSKDRNIKRKINVPTLCLHWNKWTPQFDSNDKNVLPWKQKKDKVM